MFTLTLDGQTLVEHSVATALAARLPTVVVAGPGVEPPLAHHRGNPLLRVVHADRQDLAAVLAAVRPTRTADQTHAMFHDPSCPLLPPAVLREVAQTTGQRPDDVIALSRPVTDTVKSVRDGHIHQTVPRTSLRTLGSPVVVPFSVLDTLDLTGVTSLVGLLGAIGPAHHIEHLPAPVVGRVVGAAEDTALLQALRDLVGSRA